MASNPLIGTWRLLSWENRSVQDAQVSYPLGKDATGYIMYNEGNWSGVAGQPGVSAGQLGEGCERLHAVFRGGL